jgi:putative endonuclease
MSYIVYILFSEKFDRYYIGQTQDIEARIIRHNAGSVLSTKPYLPWEVRCTIYKVTRSEAIKLERKLKNLNRERLLLFIGKYR